MTPEQKQALELREKGLSRAEIALDMGKSVAAVRSLLERARAWDRADPSARAAAAASGSEKIPHSYWVTPRGTSAYFKSDSDSNLADELVNSLKDYKPLDRKLFAPRVNSGAKGENLLVVDLADLHFGKLCVSEETGHEYRLEVARHRATEGTKALIDKARGSGVGRILFVMGNDILHTENGKTTTSNTPQDTDGSYFTAFRAAQAASIDAIAECAAVADTDLIHCMSNHDWRSGWALSQTIAAAMRGHKSVRATEYNMSERHRKYYGFERNGFLLSHGDGTKEEKLYGHFASEARPYMSQWTHLYAYLHHVHHKVNKKRGVDVFQSEKDHNGMTAVIRGGNRPEGEHLNIEYVRSPSPPDGWHDRNGYTNRQGVEVFLHHPYDGQFGRFTEWF